MFSMCVVFLQFFTLTSILNTQILTHFSVRLENFYLLNSLLLQYFLNETVIYFLLNINWATHEAVSGTYYLSVETVYNT